MPIEVVIVLIVIAFFLLSIIKSHNDLNDAFGNSIATIKEKYEPYSFKGISRKMRELGQEYNVKDYLIHIGIAGVIGFVLPYAYFHNIIYSIIYSVLSIMLVPYLQYLNSKRIYSEFLFEQVQTYCTNTIMEFQTTQSFVKALEGVYESGVLQEPLKSDVKIMIDMAYQNGDILNSINYMDQRYHYYMVRNMHQLFYQVTKEGAHDMTDILDNMLSDIDELVEGVYRDRMDRKTFLGKFLTFGFMLYALGMMIQMLIEPQTYTIMLSKWYVIIILNLIIIVNTYFLVDGYKFYNENVGAE